MRCDQWCVWRCGCVRTVPYRRGGICGKLKYDASCVSIVSFKSWLCFYMWIKVQLIVTAVQSYL